ncbi:Na+/H+ antiporter [Microbacterium gorillae]|uniref:Na+/H+ antiporter n=1 Tax=Microbacterium gorillae TaxID=1231063 RepID=UPI00058DABE1|nr:Na+/H+ antiporter [Microbacterium gorillae]
MEGLEVTVLLGVAVLVGTILAPKLRLAAPLVLLIIGLLLGFVPALRDIQLPPETVLLLFLPIMLFWESLTTSLRAIRRDFRYILPMSTLLVLVTAFAVAGVATWMGLPWEAALLLGAAVAPPDATAVAALGRLLPQRMFMKLKAESLTNDGTALVIYAIAVSLATGAHVTPLSVTWTVIDSYLGGILAGAVIAALAWLILRRMERTITINLTLVIVPFAAYLLAELIGASGVLAVVVSGLIVAVVSPQVTTPESRIEARSTLSFGTFVLNGALFVLIGLEVQFVVREINASELPWLVLVTLATVVVLFAVRYLFQLLSVPLAGRTGHSGPRHRARLVSTMAGFRGAISLAIALSVPMTTQSGAPLAGRDEIVFITAGVIVIGLLLQGPLLPAVVRWAGLPADTVADEETELAQRVLSGAALAALDDIAEREGVSAEVRDRARRQGYEKLELLNARSLQRQQERVEGAVVGLPVRGGPASTPEGSGLRLIAASTDVDVMARSPIVHAEELRRLTLAMLGEKRELLQRLRREGTVDDLVAWDVQTSLDREEIRVRGARDDGA